MKFIIFLFFACLVKYNWYIWPTDNTSKQKSDVLDEKFVQQSLQSDQPLSSNKQGKLFVINLSFTTK